MSDEHPHSYVINYVILIMVTIDIASYSDCNAPYTIGNSVK